MDIADTHTLTSRSLSQIKQRRGQKQAWKKNNGRYRKSKFNFLFATNLQYKHKDFHQVIGSTER